jgi:hypothetical protein
MGPRQESPPLPDIAWNLVPERQCVQQLIMRECNWMQAMEGDIDPCHTSFLHSTLPDFRSDDQDPRERKPSVRVTIAALLADKAPFQQAVDTPYGVMLGSRRRANEQTDQWRVYQVLFPFHTYVGGGGSVSAWVPMDDDHVMKWRIFYFPDRELSEEERASLEFIHGGYEPATSDWLGRWRLAGNMANSFFLDRDRQRTQTFTGMPNSNNLHDAAVIESMGAIVDRRKEHLGVADAGIIRVRRRWIEAAKALRDRGEVPPCVDDPALFRVAPAQMMLPTGQSWYEAAKILIGRLDPVVRV